MIRIDTKLLIKAQKEYPTSIIKKQVQKKDNFILQINFDPIGIRKEYTTLISIYKRFSDEIDNLEKNISTKLNDKDIDIVYKPVNNRLFYLEKVSFDDNQQKQKFHITEADRVLNLQTKLKDKIYSIFEKNKSLIVIPIKPATPSESIISDYNDFISQLSDDKKNYHNKIEYYLEKKLYQAIDVWLYPLKKTFSISMQSPQDLNIYFFEIYLSGKMIYLYDDNSKPLKKLRTEFNYESLEKILKKPILKISTKIKDSLNNIHKINIFINFNHTIKLVFEEYLKTYDVSTNKNHFNMNIIKEITYLSLGSLFNNIRNYDFQFKTYSTHNLTKNLLVKERIEYNDSMTYKATNRHLFYSFNLIKNLQPT